MLPNFDSLGQYSDRSLPVGDELGRSRQDRPILGYRFGHGPIKVSLIAGCHADEPVGPRLLERFVRLLGGADRGDGLLESFHWWIVPHINPDGAARNAAWSDDVETAFDPIEYLRSAEREPPGDDIEFGFPRGADDAGARPENRAVYDWWSRDGSPFALHLSMHGMAFAGGPWFLIDAAWSDRCLIVMDRCKSMVAQLGLALHDVQRHGEKGFTRIARGFCTRPNSTAMADFFHERGDPDTAGLFRPSSMEVIRSFGGDALTLVSEIPLFVLPGVGEQIDPVDVVAGEWRERVLAWKARLALGDVSVPVEVTSSGLQPVRIEDQMRLQWELIRAGVEQVSR